MDNEYKNGYISDDALDALFLTLNSFNAEKIHQIMTYLEWTWSDTSNGTKMVPPPEDIRETSFKMLKEAYHAWWEKKDYNDTYFIATGGIEATYIFDNEEKDEKYKHIFTLKFVAEEASNF